MSENQSRELTIEIKDILGIIRKRKWLIILPIILVTIIAFAGSYLLEERYQSSTMIKIDQTQYLSPQLRAMVPGQEDQRFTEMQRRSRLVAMHNEILSSQYLSKLINALELNGDSDVLKEAARLHNKRPDIPVENLVYRIIIERLRENISISFNGEDIIEIKAESNDPQMAMQIATKLAEIFKEERLKRDLSGVRGALDFSDEQLQIYKKNLEDAERRKAQFASEFIKNQLDESVASEGNVRTIMADIDNLELQIEENIKNQTQVRTKLASYSKSDLTIPHGDEREQFREEIYQEAKRLAEFMLKYSWSDPKVFNSNLRITDELRELDRMIGAAVDEKFADKPAEERESLTLLFSLQSHEIVLRKKLNELQLALSRLRERIAMAPEYEIQMRNLENEVASAREIYEKFKDQLTGSTISQSLMRGESESKYQIIEPASVPLSPIKPNRVKIAMLGAVLGMVIGSAAALLVEMLDNSFKKVDEVEQYLGVPVLATIPSIGPIRSKVK